MPKKEDKPRRKLVVEEVETPIENNEMVSSTALEKAEVKEEAIPETKEEVKEEKPQILEEAAATESPTASEEMEKEIHQEEKHLHDIHTGAAAAEQQAAAPPPGKKQGSPILWILIPGIFLLGALLGGIVFYQKGINKGEFQTPTPSSTPEGTPVPTPSASPVSKADLSKYPIKIQNGSGIPGAANDAKDVVTKAGFKVSGTGNAATYDYTKTIIEVKSDVPQGFTDLLTQTLSGMYVLGDNVTLKDSSADEVIIIVGSSKAK